MEHLKRLLKRLEESAPKAVCRYDPETGLSVEAEEILYEGDYEEVLDELEALSPEDQQRFYELWLETHPQPQAPSSPQREPKGTTRTETQPARTPRAVLLEWIVVHVKDPDRMLQHGNLALERKLSPVIQAVRRRLARCETWSEFREELRRIVRQLPGCAFLVRWDDEPPQIYAHGVPPEILRRCWQKHVPKGDYHRYNPERDDFETYSFQIRRFSRVQMPMSSW
ncbi:hypothetical protein [Thermosulfurimonas sp. F29]|uniref:hypothetical protein n=1 Tax=Thermosulfurimonas sp. F29 TaxID=2867247 RepID=UPI001C837740|nr:hypothetical protein [Thermosulfurimonas sp. F29]MBX6423393.1 hypothetical protein [Thermosulfurimonas sp. F29]